MNLFKQLKSITPNFIKKFLLRSIYSIRVLKYTGSKYYCPVCKHHLDSFISLESICDGKFVAELNVNGDMHKANEYETFNIHNFMCPVCSAQDKARLYALYLNKKLVEIKDGKRINFVHFAPEGGLPQLLKWDKRLNYRTADLFREDVDDRVDLTNMLIYPNESLDAFICSHILEHIPDDKTAISELHRVLKVGGWGIIMVPILLSIDNTYEDATKVTEEDRLKHFGLEDHLRVYAKNDFVSLLTGAGFVVNQLGQDFFSENVFNKCGLTKTSVLYIVEKI